MSHQETKVAYLDGWRGIAILLVLIGHFGPESMDALGKFGVTLFFVLSGFFMSKLLFIKEVALDSFFVRRFSRVMPALWLFIVSMILWARYIQPTPFQPSTFEILTTFTFLRTYLPIPLSIWADQWPTSHLWSLNVEEHSYIFLALVSVTFARMRSKGPAILFMLASVLGAIAISFYYVNIASPRGASPWFIRTQCAAIGIVTSALYHAYLHFYKPEWICRFSIPSIFALGLAGAIFTPLVPKGIGKTYLMVLLAPILCAFAINHAAGFPALIKKILSSTFLQWFGLYSFSIYLWQQPLHFYARETNIGQLPCLLFALLLGFLSFHIIENPSRLYLNRRWDIYKNRRDSTVTSSTTLTD